MKDLNLLLIAAAGLYAGYYFAKQKNDLAAYVLPTGNMSSGSTDGVFDTKTPSNLPEGTFDTGAFYPGENTPVKGPGIQGSRCSCHQPPISRSVYGYRFRKPFVV